MISKKFAQGIKDQDWATVWIEILIVVVGVYVGIFLGEAAEEREIQRDVNRTLAVLQTQLQEDLAHLDSVLLVLNGVIERYDQLIILLGEDPVDMEAVNRVGLNEASTNMRTFFPNRSAYQSIRDLGYLSEIQDTGLQISIANLYEREYMRATTNGHSIDDMVGDYHMFLRNNYWNRAQSTFINDDPESVIKLSNGLMSLRGYALNFTYLLHEGVRPELVKNIEALQLYLQENAG